MEKFTAEEYRLASKLQFSEANSLFDRPDAEAGENIQIHRGMSLYLAGLAVECLFRAYRLRASLEFTENHSLQILFAESRLTELYEQSLISRNMEVTSWQSRVVELGRSVNAVHESWSNNFRFATDAKIVKFLWNKKLIAKPENRGGKSRVLKNYTRAILERVESILDLGEELWN